MASSSTRRRFTREFKLDVIAQSQTCPSIVALARDLGLRPELIYRWRAEFTQDPARSFPGNGHPQQTPNAATGARCKDPSGGSPDHNLQCIAPGGTESPPAALHRDAAESGLGHRSHLYQTADGLAVFHRDPGSVPPESGGVGLQRRDDGRGNHRGGTPPGVAARTAEASAPVPFGSRQAVCGTALPGAPRSI